jgi:hypothetical protein
MSLSDQAKANVEAIELRLAEFDQLFRQFCSRHNYSFSSFVGVWPRRRAWRRQEIDRCLDLTMDVDVQEVLARGFHPELPWSMYASASIHPGTDPDVHVLSRPVFERVPFSQLEAAIANGLQRGLAILDAFTEKAVLTEGRKFATRTETGAAPIGDPTS